LSEDWTRRVALIFYTINLIAIVVAAADGVAGGEPALRFQERQAITYLSSNQLAASALLAWIVFLLRDRLRRRDAARDYAHWLWAVSAAGFFYLMLDETFQFHEGMDGSVARLFGAMEDPKLDGASTLAYGVAAAALCYWFRSEIFRYRQTIWLFAVGGVFLVVTSLLDSGEATQPKIVLEESAKLLGVVSFFLGHLAAFAGVVSELRLDLGIEAPVRSGFDRSRDFEGRSDGGVHLS
jgi:hypothetical protein